MRAVHKSHVRHLYKVTCRDVFYIVNGTYKKRLGSRIVTNKQLRLTNKQLIYLTTIKCKGNAVLGYFIYNRKDKLYYFIDLATYYEDYICINECIKRK